MAAESKLILTPAGNAPSSRDARLIGAVLVDAGRLKVEDAERILQLQREKGLRFGDAALRLGVLSQADIDFALARQFDFVRLERGKSAMSEEVLAAYEPLAPQVEAMRTLRSQLMLRWLDGGPAHKALAIVSGERREGRSYVVANLAVLFAQLGLRTLLIDADMRNPRQHRIFGIDNRSGLSTVLAGRGGPDAVQRIPSMRNLSVLPAGAPPPNAQELLARPAFTQLLHQLAPQLDLVLLDTPAASETADAQIIAVRCGAALIVARKNAARRWQVQGISDTVAQARAMIVGAVLNSY